MKVEIVKDDPHPLDQNYRYYEAKMTGKLIVTPAFPRFNVAVAFTYYNRDCLATQACRIASDYTNQVYKIVRQLVEDELVKLDEEARKQSHESDG